MGRKEETSALNLSGLDLELPQLQATTPLPYCAILGGVSQISRRALLWLLSSSDCPDEGGDESKGEISLWEGDGHPKGN